MCARVTRTNVCAVVKTGRCQGTHVCPGFIYATGPFYPSVVAPLLCVLPFVAANSIIESDKGRHAQAQSLLMLGRVSGNRTHPACNTPRSPSANFHTADVEKAGPA